MTAQVSDRCSQLALAEEGWAGRDSSCGAQLGLTGQGVLVAAILLAAAPLGAHVVLRVHGDAEESGLILAGFRTPLVAGHHQGGLCRMAVGRGLSGPGAQWPLVWTLALRCLPHLRVAPAHCCLERSLPAPQCQTPLFAWGVV